MTRPQTLVFCGCCKRQVEQLDALYGCCDACAFCQSLTFGPDAPADAECCHGLGADCCARGKGVASSGEDENVPKCADAGAALVQGLRDPRTGIRYAGHIDFGFETHGLKGVVFRLPLEPFAGVNREPAFGGFWAYPLRPANCRADLPVGQPEMSHTRARARSL